MRTHSPCFIESLESRALLSSSFSIISIPGDFFIDFRNNSATRATLGNPLDSTDTIRPDAQVLSTKFRGDTLTIRVLYTDNRRIDRQTIDSHDLAVTTGDGFSLTARLAATHRQNGGRAIRATYKTAIPDRIRDRNSPFGRMSIRVIQNAVSDTSGNTVDEQFIGDASLISGSSFPPGNAFAVDLGRGSTFSF